MAGLLLWATVWATAFGFVEGAIVVYLRALVYPEGFAFPLAEVPDALLATELVREAATIVMLLAVARLSTTGAMRRFAVFAWCFGVWDLVYYATLWLVLGWPASLLEPDVLFLIPAPWVAPVLAPALVSLSLMGAAAAILAEPAGRDWSFLRPRDWALEVAAGLVIIASFLWDAAPAMQGRVPGPYPWWLFALGWLGGLAWWWRRWRVRDAAR